LAFLCPAAVLAGFGWLAVALAVPGLFAVRSTLRQLGGTGLLGLALSAPLLVLPLLPPQWLLNWPVAAELAGTGRKAVASVLLVVLALRFVLQAQLRGGGARRLLDAMVHGLESLPQVLVALILVRLG